VYANPEAYFDQNEWNQFRWIRTTFERTVYTRFSYPISKMKEEAIKIIGH
jgi:hypothetical protein